MKIEFMLNELGGDWWFDLGLCYQPVMHPQYKKVFTVSLVFATVYIRFHKIRRDEI